MQCQSTVWREWQRERNGRREVGRHIREQGERKEEGRKSDSREERGIKGMRCEKQKKYPLDSRCPSNRLVLVGWLVAGLEAGWRRRRQRYEMTGGEQLTYRHRHGHPATVHACQEGPQSRRPKNSLHHLIWWGFSPYSSLWWPKTVSWNSCPDILILRICKFKIVIINRLRSFTLSVLNCTIH